MVLYGTFYTSPRKELRFRIKEKSNLKESTFTLSDYSIARFSNEQIIDVNSHVYDKAPLKMIAKMVSYTQLEHNKTRHFQSEFQYITFSDDISWVQLGSFQ